MQNVTDAIVIQKNYPCSTRKVTENYHAHAHCFFAVDNIKNKEVMVTDYLDKIMVAALFRSTIFLKRISMKSRGSRTMTTNYEVMSIRTDTYDVIEHLQC